MLSSTGYLYTDITSDITENDLDVVSDLWEVDGREVYRGTCDPRYTHANVYWMYNENLERVGCAEHSLTDHADTSFRWFRESEFGTLLQEDGWESKDDLWSYLPKHVFDRLINEGWTTATSFLEHCLRGPVRIVTPAMVLVRPLVYTCSTCGRKSFKPQEGCDVTATRLDFPVKEKVFFVDEDLIVHQPPSVSSIWSRLGSTLPQHVDDSLQELEQVQAQEPLQTEPSPPPPDAPPPRPLPEESPSLPQPPEDAQSPAQSHP